MGGNSGKKKPLAGGAAVPTKMHHSQECQKDEGPLPQGLGGGENMLHKNGAKRDSREKKRFVANIARLSRPALGGEKKVM